MKMGHPFLSLKSTHPTLPLKRHSDKICKNNTAKVTLRLKSTPLSQKQDQVQVILACWSEEVLLKIWSYFTPVLNANLAAVT
jgi:hypothetical protein